MKIIGKVALVAAGISLSTFAFAKGDEHKGGKPEVGGGHVPAKGPPAAHAPFDAHPHETESHVVVHGGHPDVPHVDRAHDEWHGHNFDPHDPHYHVDRPYEHGRWNGGFGRDHVWVMGGGTRERFMFNNWAWSVTPYDYNVVSGWDWNNDQVVIYDDPDHGCFYLAYNPRLGTYAHVEYQGGP